ncbi:Protein of unknown function [Pyronema omphalodes CBS 100304]|uniref:Uncharacterized protein n=1 Tax=Pyronema omphalodes (strain CBS 100304) TaxID=1076935 RepID=U4LVX8_PYROM|nr:Protein of unknown function [Pyronema omphalodes CBS 100304]
MTFCSCGFSAAMPVKEGLFPSTPMKKNVAFPIEFLDLRPEGGEGDTWRVLGTELKWKHEEFWKNYPKVSDGLAVLVKNAWDTWINVKHDVERRRAEKLRIPADQGIVNTGRHGMDGGDVIGISNRQKIMVLLQEVLFWYSQPQFRSFLHNSGM